MGDQTGNMKFLDELFERRGREELAKTAKNVKIIQWGCSVQRLAQQTFNLPGQGSNPCSPTKFYV